MIPRLLTALLLIGWGAQALSQTGQPTVPSIPERIDALLERPAALRTSWGILVRNLDTGATVYERNADKLFVPASNVKLFATAIALRRLGADYAFTTAVVAEGSVDDQGALTGDLRLVGGGDPNLSSRVVPYRKKDDYSSDRLQPARRLARQIQEAGIRRVTGDLVGDDSRYVWQPYALGWSYADTLQGYGSPASALVFNDNIIDVHVTPGAIGGPARMRVVPDLPFFRFTNRSVTVSGRHVERRLSVRRGEPADDLVLAGQIPSRSRGRTFQLAAQDPARYAALALRAALEDLGIAIEGAVASQHLFPDGLRSLRSLPKPSPRNAGDAVAEFTSANLAEAIRVVNKDSQNLHAEMLLREVALQESGVGSQEAAVASMRRFLAEVGLRSGEFFLRDGSGLSRHNLLAPRGTVRLLEYMWLSDDREAYLNSLPVAGHDGTLDWRFRQVVTRGRIRAKTGSMSHVLALSGYAEGAAGETLAFSIFANNFGMNSSSTRQLVDAIVSTLVRAGPQ